MRFAATVIYVDDVPDILDFYGAAFGLEPRFVDLDVQLQGRSSGEKYQFAELATDGTALMLATPALGSLLMPGFARSPTGMPAGVEVAFYTDDVGAAFDRAVRAGVATVRPPERMPWGQTVAYVRSKEGTFVGICTPPAAAGP
jgi:lactoylglutathione lyase